MFKRTALIIFLVLVLSACGGTGPAPQETPTAVAIAASTPVEILASPTPVPLTETPLPTNTPTATATPVPQDYGPDNFPADVNPLTGLQVSDPTLLDRRPLAVKIQTFPRGQRPPWGASLADIVYDYYQNDGLTRLNAIFYSNDAEQVGPIRSARLFDSDIIRMYKAIFAFGGADQRILTRLFSTEYADRLVLEGNNICPVMCRIDPNVYNFLITNTKELGPYVAKKGVTNDRQDLNGMTFQHQSPSGGDPGTQVYTRYSISAYVRWDYDPTTGRYLRFEDTKEASTIQEEDYEKFIDRLTNQQIAADNVVVLYAVHEFPLGNKKIVDILLSGSGDAVAFRDGQAYQVKWNRPAQDSTLFLTYPDGTVFPFKPGTTWFQVIGQTSQKEIDGGTWRFTHNFP